MSTTAADPLESLGTARPDDARLTELVRAATGDPGAVPLTAVAEPIDYLVGTPSTAALIRMRGTARRTDGGPTQWSIFVKRLQSPRHWDQLHLIPEPFREEFVEQLPWRLEIAAHGPELAAQLPEGMRLPRMYRIDETPDDRATLWMEDVVQDGSAWDLDRFRRAAYLLGRMAGNRLPDRVGPLLPRPFVTEPGIALWHYFHKRVRLGALAPLADDGLWRHPLLASAVCQSGEHRLRDDLFAAAALSDAVLERLNTLPQTYQHGDASPQNLLVPADEPDTFVMIDPGFDCPQAAGFDLGQLLIGLGHAGILDADDLRAVHEVIVDPFTEGLNADGHVATAEQVRYGYLGSMLLRSAFSALPIELLGMPPTDELAALFEQRVRLTRFMLDLAREID